MQFLAYLAVVIVGSLIAYALAPKPPKQKPPSLEDFDLPTAEEGRSIPWIFGTYRITDPNIIWYGDLETRTKTKNKVKTRLYRMGLHLECCIGPVDALVALHYGGKDCGITEVTESDRITISLPNLFGGRDKEGGIDGDFDICFGEPTQAVNDYLLAQIGAPLSAFRDSLTIVGRKPSLVANSTYIKPLHPTVRCVTQGWADGACWYEETAIVPDTFDTTPTVIAEAETTWEYVIVGSLLDTSNPAALSPPGSGWTSGQAPFGRLAPYGNFDPAYPVQTTWSYNTSLWLRKSINFSAGAVTVSGRIENGVGIYVDGDYIGGENLDNSQIALNQGRPFSVTIAAGTYTGTHTLYVLAVDEADGGLPDSYLDNYDNTYLHAVVSSVGISTAAQWDMNPAHMIYKVLTDTDQGLAEPSATIDDTSFRAAALTLYTERFGLSTQWRNEGPVRDFIGEVCTHAGAVLTLDPQTGLTQLVLLRDDYDAGSLDLIDDDQVIEVVEWQDAADGETVNEVTVEFRERDGSTGSVTWPNRASIQQLGRIHQTLSFPMISRRELALRVAKRECLQRSSNLSRGKIKVSRHGWDKLPGAVFRFAHAGEGIDELVVRVIDIDLGTLTDGAITVNVIQDIFSLGDTLTDIGEQDNEWTPPDTDPAPATAQDVMEAPYWQLLADLGPADVAVLADAGGWMIPLAAQPTSMALGFDCWPTIPPGGSWESSTDLPFTPCAELTAALARDGTAITWATVGAITPDAEVDDFVLIGTGASAEICRLTAFGSGTASLSRGMLDTTPQEHASGALVWFLPTDPEDWPRDRYAWISWAPGSMKLLTRAPSGVLDAGDATAITVTPSERQVRPYPPGDIQIGGQSWPTAPLDGSVAITWAHRDRVTQGSTVVLQDDATDYGPEAGTTYNVWAYDDTDDTLLDSDTALAVATWTPTITISTRVRIEIEAARDGFESWQRQVRTYEYLETGGILAENGDYLLTESGDYLLTEA